MTHVASELQSPGAGFSRVDILDGASYRDNSTILIVPTREPFIHYEVWSRWAMMMKPMNQKFHMQMCVGDEVGIAYNRMIAQILQHPELSKWKFVMTVESDNLIPPDAHQRLLETIHKGFDGVSGLYFTKGPVNMPMAYGNAKSFAERGELEFRPLDIRQALAQGNIVEVNGIAMGCSLYRLDLFREVPAPWFVTVSDWVPEKGPAAMTQDLYFCKNAKAKGKRFAVDMRVKVGHMDLATGEVY